jgi:ribonuclease PH
LWTSSFIREPVAAISVGIVDSRILLDLAYEEDSRAEVDCNVVMTASGKFIEVQGTAEDAPFDRGQLDAMLGMDSTGIQELIATQRRLLAERAAATK